MFVKENGKVFAKWRLWLSNLRQNCFMGNISLSFKSSCYCPSIKTNILPNFGNGPAPLNLYFIYYETLNT